VSASRTIGPLTDPQKVAPDRPDEGWFQAAGSCRASTIEEIEIKGQTLVKEKSMRSMHVVPIALAVVLDACADAGCRTTGTAEARPCEVVSTSATRAASKPLQVREAPADSLRALTLRVDRQFTNYERAKALRALNEWNHALDGNVRQACIDEHALWKVAKRMPLEAFAWCETEEGRQPDAGRAAGAGGLDRRT
jgi:hypothetical protein